jgi:hypothetical protein
MARVIRGKTIYVLLHDGELVGTWSSLKQLCIDMNEKETFASYSTLSKKIIDERKASESDDLFTGSLSFSTKANKSYRIEIDILK